MTKDYLLNGCALNFNMASAATGGYNFQGFRKGMYVELLLMFLIYFASQIYQAIKLSQRNSLIIQSNSRRAKLENSRQNYSYPGIKNAGIESSPYILLIMLLLSDLLFYSTHCLQGFLSPIFTLCFSASTSSCSWNWKRVLHRVCWEVTLLLLSDVVMQFNSHDLRFSGSRL